jgi:hypothetical protein
VAPAFLPVALVFAMLLSACASRSTRVDAVWGSKRTETIDAADQDLFASDRASRLRIKASPLPASEQREEFRVTWHSADARLVKFEYRQVNVPDTIVALTFPAVDQDNHVFAVRGDDYVNGGPVTAWRASLWNGDQLLDEKKSALW